MRQRRLRKLTIALGIALVAGATSLSAQADGRLDLYIFPSPSGIQWHSPSALAWSTVRSELVWTPHDRRHAIGHVNVRVTCALPDGSQREILTGMTSDGNKNELDALFRKKIGLGILFHTLPGRLESAKEIEDQLPARFERGDISMLSHQISDATCARLMEFHDRYESNGDGSKYGLPNRPRHHEGAGCSAYGVAYLDLAGLLSPELHAEWSKTIRVPVDLIGGQEADTPARRVSFFRILFSPWRRWATGAEEHRAVHFWDPDAMHQWIQKVFHSEREDYNRVSLDNSVGLMKDARNQPTPTDPIFVE